MSGTVLADTGPLYAAVDPSDGHHERAQGDIRRLNSEGLGVAVAYPTLCECYSLVLYKLGAVTAQGWMGEIEGGSFLIEPHSRGLPRGCWPDTRVSGSGVEHVRRRHRGRQSAAQDAGLDVRSSLRRGSGRRVARRVAAVEFNVTDQRSVGDITCRLRRDLSPSRLACGRFTGV